jgi:hypothetical protein
MVASDYWPRALFGGLLWGDLPVRFVYTDEAGTSANEPTTIVVGLIVDADNQLMTAEAAINEILGAVLSKFREKFIFHATDVWGSEKYREEWTVPIRLAQTHTICSGGDPKNQGFKEL